MNLRPVNHAARRAAARAEPSPLTALRELMATVYATDVAAATPAICDALRVEAAAGGQPGDELLGHALATLARGAEALAREVEREMRARFDAKLRPGDPFAKTSRLSPAQLAQVDELELKLEIEIDQCGLELERRCAGDLWDLTAVLADLLGREGLRDTENPLHPRMLLRSLATALARLGFDPFSRLAMFRAYAPALPRIALDLYSQERMMVAEMGLAGARARPVASVEPAHI